MITHKQANKRTCRQTNKAAKANKIIQQSNVYISSSNARQWKKCQWSNKCGCERHIYKKAGAYKQGLKNWSKMKANYFFARAARFLSSGFVLAVNNLANRLQNWFNVSIIVTHSEKLVGGTTTFWLFLSF